jgi:hypothetical protein
MAAPIKKKPYRVVPLARLVLFKLYVAHVNDEPKSQFNVDEIASLFDVPISKNLIRSATDFLKGRAYGEPALISRTKNKSTEEYEFKIAQEGIFLVEKELRRKDSDIAYFAEHGDAVIDDIAGIDAIFMSHAEMLETETWVPLEIDREDPQYKAAVTDVEAALEVIRGDNGFAVEFPDERAGILSTLEDGLRWLKANTPTRSQVMSSLVAPLRWVASKFSGVIIGEVAKKAAQSLLDYLGSFF